MTDEQFDQWLEAMIRAEENYPVTACGDPSMLKQKEKKDV